MVVVPDSAGLCARLLGQRLHHTDPATELFDAAAHEMASLAACDLAAEIVVGSRSDAEPCGVVNPLEVPDFCASTTGAVRVDILAEPAGQSLMSIVVPGSCLPVSQASHQASGSYQLVSRSRAINSIALGMDVLLLDDAVSVGDLRDMQVGDTLLLSAKTQSPVQVAMASGGVKLGFARLGARGGQKAIRVESGSI